MLYQNPILKGFHPDPSICRVGDDYYLVTSTFEFFPGVPVYHSKNLVNWTLINYCLTRDSQLDLTHREPHEYLPIDISGGIYAPTLRYHDGIFYLASTNVSTGGNFIITASDIYGTWSDPIYIRQGGIDPSLFWENDRTYFCSSAFVNGIHGIYLCEIDINTGEQLTKSVLISQGNGGIAPEGPHIYKRNGLYYLLLAEGGTSYGHMVTIFRSANLYGPYESCPHNPILSHKDSDSSIQCVGHGDIFEDQNQNWWMTALGIRQLGPSLHNLGRETFLTPILWTEDGWPVAGNGGTLDYQMDGPLPATVLPVNNEFIDTFTSSSLRSEYNFIKNPAMDNYQLSPESGTLTLDGQEYSMSEPVKSPVFIGVRQKEFITVTTAQILVNSLKDNQKVGICAYYSPSYHYEIYLTKVNGQYQVCLNKRVHDMEAVTAFHVLNAPRVLYLHIESARDFYTFSYSTDESDFVILGKGATAGLCSEGTSSMTFVGTYLGMFAENGPARFQSFSCICP